MWLPTVSVQISSQKSPVHVLDYGKTQRPNPHFRFVVVLLLPFFLLALLLDTPTSPVLYFTLFSALSYPPSSLQLSRLASLYLAIQSQPTSSTHHARTLGSLNPSLLHQPSLSFFSTISSFHLPTTPPLRRTTSSPLRFVLY